MASKTRKQRRAEKFSKKKSTVSQKKAKDKSKILKYYNKEYKKLMLIPITLLILSFLILGVSFLQNGEFINKGVSIKGGLSLTLLSDTLNELDVKDKLTDTYPNSDIEVRTLTSSGRQAGLIIEASDVDEESLRKVIELNYGVRSSDYTVEITGSSLGQSFYKQILLAIVIAFLFMGTAVYFYFRSFLPSIAIILAALSDMIITLGVVSLFNMKITTAGIAAFLMLIGYSVDTNILLTTRLLKRKEGSVMDRIYSAFKTGMTMNITTIIALIVALIVSTSDVIKQIMIILLIGLLADIINTWIQNVGILRWYLEEKKK